MTTPTTSGSDSFTFQEPGLLIDGELQVVLARCNPADQPVKGWVPSYDFELRVPAGAPAQQQQVVGLINFRAINTPSLEMYGGHFGYGVHAPFRGRRYAERGVRLLLPFARRHGYRTIWITCNPDNYASRRTCERLGAALVEIVSLPLDNDQYLAGDRAKCRYRIDL